MYRRLLPFPLPLPLLFLFLALCFGGVRAAEPPAVAAAADLKFALTEAATQFERDSGQKVRLSFGSSGNFTQQIENGAPFELFLSADEAFVFRLAEAGHTLDRGAQYAIGRLVLFVPERSPLKPDATLEDLRAALTDGRLRRFAIANPEHAPYGRAARSVLRHAGLWTAIEPRLVLGENAAQAMDSNRSPTMLTAVSSSSTPAQTATDGRTSPLSASRGRMAKP